MVENKYVCKNKETTIDWNGFAMHHSNILNIIVAGRKNSRHHGNFYHFCSQQGLMLHSRVKFLGLIPNKQVGIEYH